jgi:hypothetical protein
MLDKIRAIIIRSLIPTARVSLLLLLLPQAIGYCLSACQHDLVFDAKKIVGRGRRTDPKKAIVTLHHWHCITEMRTQAKRKNEQGVS